MERWLYRLSRNQYADRFVLKGALMLLVWNAPVMRPTRDVDLLGRVSNDPAPSASSLPKYAETQWTMMVSTLTQTAWRQARSLKTPIMLACERNFARPWQQ